MVAQIGIDGWKTIAESLQLKNRRDAILEFMKIDFNDVELNPYFNKS